MWKACILSAAFIQVIRCGSLGDESDLIIRTIFSNYESQAHPNSNREDGSVQIQIGLNPQSYELDEATAVLTSHFWLALAWRDKRLIWDQRQHQNVSKVYVSPDRVWKPDIRFFNSVVHEDYESTDVLINSDGSLFWVPPVTSHTLCEGLDLTYWPWDFQECAIVIGSWTKSGWQLDPVLMGHTKENVTTITSGNYEGAHWKVIQSYARREVKYYDSGEAVLVPWPAIRVEVRLQRQSHVDRKLTVLPLILVSCLSLASFWTHPSSGHRIKLGCLNLILLLLVLQQTRWLLPMNAQLPLVVSFAGSLAVLVTIQLLLALSIANLVSRRDTPPAYLIWPLQGSLGNFLCLSDMPLVGQIPGMTGYSIDVEALRVEAEQQRQTSAAASRMSSSSTETAANTNEEKSSTSLEKNGFSGWNLLCQAIDRLLFIAYLAIILIFMASYLGGAAIALSNAPELNLEHLE